MNKERLLHVTMIGSIGLNVAKFELRIWLEFLSCFFPSLVVVVESSDIEPKDLGNIYEH